MDNKKMKLNEKYFKDEEKNKDGITFHQQSPRFMNSSNNKSNQISSIQSSPQQIKFKDESQTTPNQSPRSSTKSINNNSQQLSNQSKIARQSFEQSITSSLNDFNLFQYKGEKDFFTKAQQKLNEIQSDGDILVPKLLEKIYKKVLEEDYSITSLQRIMTRSKNTWKEHLKIKNQTSYQCLIANILPHFTRSLAKRSLANIQDLLKITLLYQYEYYLGIEKQLNSILDLFNKMLQIPQSTEGEEIISNHVQRLVLLNIQNFCISTISSKFQSEFQLIFKRIYELIIHFFHTQSNNNNVQSISSLSESTGNYYSFLRFLATLLRTGTMVIVELKDNKIFSADANNQKLTEKVFLKIFKYLFLGNPTFHVTVFGSNPVGQSNQMKYNQSQFEYSSLVGSRNNCEIISSSHQMNNSFSGSSQSEWSENDEMNGINDRNKIESIEGKIRNYTCLLLQTIIRQFPSILKNQWQTTIKSNNMTKEYLESLKSHHSLDQKNIIEEQKNNNQDIQNQDEDQKEINKQKVQQQNNRQVREFQLLHPNYMEASLLSCLIFEENNKIKGNVLATLSALIENLPSKQLVSGLDVSKFEKQTTTFKPQSYLIYQSYNNIHFTLIHLLQQQLAINSNNSNNNKGQILSSSNNLLNQNNNQMQDNQMNNNNNINQKQDDLIINELDEESLSIYNQILKVYISLFNYTVQLEKMPFNDGIDLLLRQCIFKILRQIQTSDSSLEALHLKYNALQILNCIAKCSKRFDEFAINYVQSKNDSNENGNNNGNVDQQYENVNSNEYNLFQLLMKEIQLKINYSSNNNNSTLSQSQIQDNQQKLEQSQLMNDISLYQKEDALREMIILESITLMTNLQVHYFDSTLFNPFNNLIQMKNDISDNIYNYPNWFKITELIKYYEETKIKTSTDKKRLLLLYELIIMIAEKRNNALEVISKLQQNQLQTKTKDNDNKEDMQENEEEIEDEEKENNTNNSNKITFSHSIESNQYLQNQILYFEKNIFSKYIMEKIQYIIQQSVILEKENECPLMISALNLSIHIRNDQWIEYSNIFQFFKEKLFSLQIQQSYRFYFIKTLGSIISCPIFNADYNNCKQILEILLKEKQQTLQKKTSANLSVISKLAQSIANCCFNMKDYSNLPLQSIKSLLATIIDFASSPKDKISPHGLRALGIFLMKINIEQYQNICNPLQEDIILCKLLQENLTHKSSKVVWNACVAIQNIFTIKNNKFNERNENKFFLSCGSISLLINSLQEVLLSIHNQKSQVYALKALQSIMNHPITIPQNLSKENNNEQQQIDQKILNEGIPQLLNVLTDIGSNIYSFHNSHSQNPSNKSLGEQVVKFLISMIHRVDKISNEILIEFIKEKYYQIISSFSQYIYQIWKNNKLDLQLAMDKEEIFQDSEKEIFNFKAKQTEKEQQQISTTTITPAKTIEQNPIQQQDMYEELLVKGQDEFKCVVFDFAYINHSHILKQQLQQLKESSLILQQVIDSNDDLSVSLTIYDHIKEYASIDLNSSILKFSIH